MNTRVRRLYREAAFVAAVCALLLLVGRAAGHCDTLNGPVVLAGRAALESGEVTPVLRWVSAPDEAEVRSAFARARLVRVQGDDAKSLADQFFLETLVRFHRASEGMPFNGIKRDAGEVGPTVAVADHALADNDVEPLVRLVTDRVARQLRDRFRAAAEAQRRKDDSVAAGRLFVRAYVEFMHYVEQVCFGAATGEHGESHVPAAGAAVAGR